MNNLPGNVPTYVTAARVKDAILPVAYTDGLRSLALVRTIDEAKHWATAADALAAWARMYKHDEAAAEARRLKAHAYRRMAKLSDELAEQVHKSGRKEPLVHLRKAGLSGAMITRVRAVGRVPQKQFDQLTKGPRPSSIATLAMHGVSASGSKMATSEAYRTFMGGKYIRANGRKFADFCRHTSAFELGKAVRPEETIAVLKLTKELKEWLEELEKSLPGPQEVP